MMDDEFNKNLGLIAWMVYEIKKKISIKRNFCALSIQKVITVFFINTNN